MNRQRGTSILVVGHRGLLGQELMAYLKVIGRLRGVDKEECDICDPGQIDQVLESWRPQWLVNAAAYTDVDGCESNRRLAFSVNARGAGNLARACRTRDVRMIQISTDFIFAGRKKEPYTEEDPPHPLSVYGESKLAGELEVRRGAGSFLIVRTAWLFGRGGKNFPDTILKLCRTSSSISVVNDQVGSPTYAPDLARAIAKLIECRAEGVVNVTNRGRCSWYDYAVYIVKIAGLSNQVKPISSRESNRAAVRPAFSVLSSLRYESLTGCRMRPWQEAVSEYIQGTAGTAGTAGMAGTDD